MASDPQVKEQTDQVMSAHEKTGELNVAMEAVLVDASDLPPEVTTEVRGFNFNDPVDFEKLMSTFYATGFQATSLANAVKVVNDMIACKFAQGRQAEKRYRPDCVTRDCGNCTIFLAYTSNMVSSGLRDIVRFLVEHNYVDVVVTTAGGIEEDFIKCLAPTYVGDFHRHRGAELRRRGVNRIGNLYVPNTNYCAFENWIMPIFDELLEEQRTKNVVFTPSKLIARLGAKINNPDSIYYWAYKNNIPVFCPALTDGSIGDMLYFHAYKNGALMLDIVDDLRTINSHAVYAENSGMIILGGGVVKHHVCNANLMRNGADYSVFVNTASEFDGSDAGAQPDEAVSWGKIRAAAQCVKVFADATLVFPLIVAQTFAKYHHSRLQEKKRAD